MQKHQFAGEAGRRAPSWYLARGDQRYGPLGDRELLLLAERGGLQTDDLLWKPGFTSWKSVHAVCGVNTLLSLRAMQNLPGSRGLIQTAHSSQIGFRTLILWPRHLVSQKTSGSPTQGTTRTAQLVSSMLR